MDVRPDRPHGDESFLLAEMDQMPRDQVDAIECLLNYMDDMELWVDQNITSNAITQLRNQVTDLQTQLREARDSAAQVQSKREAELQQAVTQLSQELSFLQIKLGGIQLILR